MHCALRGPGAVGIIRLAGMPDAPVVEQHVCGAAIKTHNGPAWLQQREIGHSTQVEHGQTGCFGAPQRGMKGRHQGRALAACGYVAAAEVTRHGNAGALRQQGAVDQLQGVARAVEHLRPVPNRLPVCADHGNLDWLHGSLRAQRLRYLGIQVHQGVGGERCAVQFVVARCVQRQQFGAQGWWHGSAGERQLPHGRGRVCSLHACGIGHCQQATVHGVERRAGHEADAQKGRGVSGHRQSGKRNQGKTPAHIVPRSGRFAPVATTWPHTMRHERNRC